ncbi:hypothetical protein BZG36_00835 [Bifiguratus adelaidae]|uniref:Protein kinase domain-containing protein n=1 Tax=Bifiguratus adelaidae TaxID=1938954 RepID=A0A261Y6K0_9FUNG|nr:hypothetical protein BZG36_00835 [Bifiguratus adelaidae]
MEDTRQGIVQKVTRLFNKAHSEKRTFPPGLTKRYRVTRKVLGVGSFAVVKECVEKSTNTPFALKVIMKKAVNGKEHMLTTELNVLKWVHHPNIVSMHEIFETTEALYIVTDLASGGELFTQLVAKGNYTEKDASKLVEQMLNGVAYLHSLDDNQIVHRDLKPENLLFQTPQPDANLMITDFGLSKMLSHQDDVLTTACGTPGYVAPEVLTRKGYGKPVDMWSIGVITYVILCGYSPFWGEDQAALFESILSGEYQFDEEYWSDVSKEAKDFIRGLLILDPSKRMPAQGALQHPWIKNRNPDHVDLLEKSRPHLTSRQRFKKSVTMLKAIDWAHPGDRHRKYEILDGLGLITKEEDPGNFAVKPSELAVSHTDDHQDGMQVIDI